MEFTVEFKKYNVAKGSQLIHETILYSDDETALKRQVTKLVKEIKPFDHFQKERPISWENYSGYGHRQDTYGKSWGPYMSNSPVKDGSTYSISIRPTAYFLSNSIEKVHDAQYKLIEVRKAIEKNFGDNVDLGKADPDLPKIINELLPAHVVALEKVFEEVEKRIKGKVKELNERMQ